jgi:hypothetical protein
MPKISVESLRQTADNPKKPICAFLLASPVGEQNGDQKLADVLFLRHAADQIFLRSWQLS